MVERYNCKVVMLGYSASIRDHEYYVQHRHLDKEQKEEQTQVGYKTEKQVGLLSRTG